MDKSSQSRDGVIVLVLVIIDVISVVILNLLGASHTVSAAFAAGIGVGGIIVYLSMATADTRDQKKNRDR